MSFVIKHKHYLNLQTLIPIIYGNGTTAHSPFGFDLNIHVGAIWFLPTMFIANIIFHLLMHINKEYLRFIIVSLLFLSGCLLSNYGYFPWSLQTALEVQIYYLFGHWLSIITKHWTEDAIFSNLFIFIIGLSLWFIGAFSGTYELNRGIADNMLAAVLGGFGSAIVILSIASLIEKHWLTLSKVLSYVGQYSLVILGVHSLDINLFDEPIMHFLQMHYWFINYSFIFYLGLMLARIIYTTIFSWIILKVKFINILLVDRNFPIKIKAKTTK